MVLRVLRSNHRRHLCQLQLVQFNFINLNLISKDQYIFKSIQYTVAKDKLQISPIISICIQPRERSYVSGAKSLCTFSAVHPIELCLIFVFDSAHTKTCSI